MTTVEGRKSLPVDPGRWKTGDWDFDPQRDHDWEDPSVVRRFIGTPEELELVADAVVRRYELTDTDPAGNERVIVGEVGDPHNPGDRGHGLGEHVVVENLRALIVAVQAHEAVRLARVEIAKESGGRERVARRWVTDRDGVRQPNGKRTTELRLWRTKILAAQAEGEEYRGLDIGVTLRPEAAFRAAAGFVGASFHADALFGGAAFHAAAGFLGATFDAGADFGGAVFDGDAFFDEANFYAPAIFDRAVFNGDSWFNLAAFHAEARFSRIQFRGNVGFDDAAFRAEARFSVTAFHAGARFAEAAFGTNTWFDDVAFHAAADFSGAAFTAGAWFGGAAFNADARFFRASFHAAARFERTAFHADASFEDAVVHRPHGSLHFDRAKFRQSVSFDWARLLGSVSFAEATLDERMTFDGARLGRRTRFSFERFLARGGATVELSGDQLRLPRRRPRARCLARHPGWRRSVARLGPVTCPVCDWCISNPSRAVMSADDYELLAADYRVQPATDWQEDLCRWMAHELRRVAVRRKAWDAFLAFMRAPFDRGSVRVLVGREETPLTWYLEYLAVIWSCVPAFGGFAARAAWHGVWGWFIQRTVVGYLLQMHRIPVAASLLMGVCAVIYAVGANDATVAYDHANGGLPEGVWERVVFGVYFTLTTFVTLGYGDYSPKGWFQLVTGFEAFCGVTLLALFTVAWGRKMVR